MRAGLGGDGRPSARAARSRAARRPPRGARCARARASPAQPRRTSSIASSSAATGATRGRSRSGADRAPARCLPLVERRRELGVDEQRRAEPARIGIAARELGLADVSGTRRRRESTRKHLKPSTPSATRPASSPALPGTTPPQSPTSTAHARRRARASPRAPSSVVVGGMQLSGMSTRVVTPPAAAARVAVSKPSHSVRPGSLMCTWVSTRPGQDASSPASSTRAGRHVVPRRRPATILPPATWTARAARRRASRPGASAGRRRRADMGRSIHGTAFAPRWGMTDIDEIGDRIYRVNTPVPEIPGGFSFNQYLVVDDEPLLFHTGGRGLFPAVSAAIETVIPLAQLRWIGFSHVEADECGALNVMLAAAPHATAVGVVGARIASPIPRPTRPPARRRRSVRDRPAPLQVARCAAHAAAWECGYLSESTTRTLLCGDLFTQPGAAKPPVTGGDIVGPSGESRTHVDYLWHTPSAPRGEGSSRCSRRARSRAGTGRRGSATALGSCRAGRRVVRMTVAPASETSLGAYTRGHTAPNSHREAQHVLAPIALVFALLFAPAARADKATPPPDKAAPAAPAEAKPVKADPIDLDRAERGRHQGAARDRRRLLDEDHRRPTVTKGTSWCRARPYRGDLRQAARTRSRRAAPAAHRAKK